jgi:hypothetical protein
MSSAPPWAPAAALSGARYSAAELSADDTVVFLLDQRELPNKEIYVSLRSAAEVATGIKRHDRPRRAGHRHQRRVWHGRRSAAAPRRARRSLPARDGAAARAAERLAPDGGEPRLGREEVHGARQRPRRRARRGAREAMAALARQIHARTSRRAGPWAASAGALPGRGDGPHALQRGRARDGRLRHRARRLPRRDRGRASASACSPTRRGLTCKARGSPRGSCTRTASPSR